MPYITASQIYGKIPQKKVNDACDDDGDGNANKIADVLNQIITNACSAVDGLLGARYPTPFTPNTEGNYPAVVVQAALLFAVEDLYNRREIIDDKVSRQANDMRDRLKLIAQRKLPLDATISEDLSAATGTMPYVPPRISQCNQTS